MTITRNQVIEYLRRNHQLAEQMRLTRFESKVISELGETFSTRGIMEHFDTSMASASRAVKGLKSKGYIKSVEFGVHERL